MKMVIWSTRTSTLCSLQILDLFQFVGFWRAFLQEMFLSYFLHWWSERITIQNTNEWCVCDLSRMYVVFSSEVSHSEHPELSPYICSNTRTRNHFLYFWLREPGLEDHSPWHSAVWVSVCSSCYLNWYNRKLCMSATVLFLKCCGRTPLLNRTSQTKTRYPICSHCYYTIHT